MSLTPRRMFLKDRLVVQGERLLEVKPGFSILAIPEHKIASTTEQLLCQRSTPSIMNVKIEIQEHSLAFPTRIRYTRGL